jgi:hypothetical protein
VGLSEKELVQFESDELALFLSQNRLELVNEIQLLSRKQAAIISSLAAYSGRKERLQEFLDRVARVERLPDGSFKYTLSKEDAATQTVHEFYLDSLIGPARQHILEAAALAKRLAHQFQDVMRAYFPKGGVPGFEPADND